MMSNRQFLSENNSVKMFVFSKMQHFPNWLFNIPTDMSEIGILGGKGRELKWRTRNYLYLFIFLLEI